MRKRTKRLPDPVDAANIRQPNFLVPAVIPMIGGEILFDWQLVDGTFVQMKGQIMDIRGSFDTNPPKAVDSDDEPRVVFAAVLGRPEMFAFTIPSIATYRAQVGVGA